MNNAELVMRRRNVKAFIQADPVSVAISRKAEPIKSAAGGYTQGTPTVLAPQQARIVLNKRRFNNGIVNSEAGDIPHTDYLLIATHDKDFRVDDTFVWLGQNYSITGLHKNRTESILCSIDLLGADNRNGA